MTWHEKVIVRILLIIAKMLTDDPGLKQQLTHLETHIVVNAPNKVKIGG